jgi:SAM-dependent methyltransferase
MKRVDDLYTDTYFADRDRTDQKRLASFKREKEFLLRHVSLSGVVCDVGCSTGEFLTTIEWRGDKYGLEVNAKAVRMAQESGIRFDKSILTETAFFDVVIFRGTLQHLLQPFWYIAKTFDALKPGGFIVFLATPNANSIVYKLFNTLPALEPDRNFYIPSDATLTNVLRHAGFDVVEIAYPYLSSPYAKPVRDHLALLVSLLFRRRPRHAFWRNMMNVIARKV